MADLYSGSYAFDEPAETPPGPLQPRYPLDGPAEPTGAPAAGNGDEDDSPPVSPPPSPTGGPPPLLYVRSERLQQLSRRLAVNADRPELVHGLVEAYGLLQVRWAAGKLHRCLPPSPSRWRACKGGVQPPCTELLVCIPPENSAAGKNHSRLVLEVPPPHSHAPLQAKPLRPLPWQAATVALPQPSSLHQLLAPAVILLGLHQLLHHLPLPYRAPP